MHNLPHLLLFSNKRLIVHDIDPRMLVLKWFYIRGGWATTVNRHKNVMT